MPEVVHCAVCGKSLRVNGLADRMHKIRLHYKESHPRLWKKSVQRGANKRKSWHKPK